MVGDLVNQDDTAARSLPPIAEVVRQYDEEVHFSDDRRAAELAYALAVRLRDAGELDQAREYARKCLAHAERLPSASLDDVASERTTVAGVPLPGMFHDGVVRSRLRDLLDD